MNRTTTHRYVRRAAVAVGTTLIGSLALTGTTTTTAQASTDCTVTLSTAGSGLPVIGTVLNAVSSYTGTGTALPLPTTTFIRVTDVNGVTVETPVANATLLPTYTIAGLDQGADIIAQTVYQVIPSGGGSPVPVTCTSDSIVVSPPSTGGGAGGTSLGATPVSSVPRVLGKVKKGKRVRADVGAVQPGVSVTYQWFKKRKHHAARPIGGATGATYKIKSANRGKRLSVVVTYTKPGYSPSVVASKARLVR